MEALRKVQLVGKVARCLQENWGVEDKTLAEFVIDLCKKSSSTEEFKEQLVANGADGDDAASTSVWKLVHGSASAVADKSSGTKSMADSGGDGTGHANRVLTEKDKK